MDWRRGWQETGWKERSRNEERKGTTKIEPNKHNENIVSKGVDEEKHGMLKGKTEEKEKTRENDKPRVFLKKRALGAKILQNMSRIAGNSFSVLEIITPFEKPQNCRENGVSCHSLKAKQQIQTKKENQAKKQK